MSIESSTRDSALLLTLEEISQLVSHSRDPGETLTNIVRLIQGRCETDVCSVYLLETERGELVLGATVGLAPSSVGRVRMRIDEGLTGLVAERMAPVMVDDAFQHPRFKYFPEAGEDPYHSFLGVPLVEAGVVLGVLVVQTVEPRAFSSGEARMLVTVAAQIAPLVSGARLLEQVLAAAHQPGETADQQDQPLGTASLRGIALSPGFGLGHAYIVNGAGVEPAAPELSKIGATAEKRRLDLAREAVHDEITRLSRRVSELVGEDHGAILQAQLMILQDRTIEADLTSCLNAGTSAESALNQTLNKYVAVFRKLTNPLFQERVFDIKDVFRRILWQLQPHGHATDAGGDRLVLVAHEASVMDLFSVDLDRLAAVVVGHGGPQSHAAILARSLGIPMVGQLLEGTTTIRPGQLLLVDGSSGLVQLDPPARPAEIKPTPVPCPASAEPSATDAVLPGLPLVEVNINLLYEVERAVELQATGVGLYRTEFLFLARRTLPSEEEQVSIYRKLIKTLRGRPASIRTFDLRPDKVALSGQITATPAFPYDWRRVLDSPPLQELFKDQVRAILRAATSGPTRIIVPLVTQTEQVQLITETVAQARRELRRDKLEFGDQLPIGFMIEAGAALPMIETWADQADFFAFGTNDLLASLLGIDRDDPVGASRTDPLHPGVLRLLQEAVESAHRAGRPVAVCGELASDPQGVLALAALRVDRLSVAVDRLESTRKALARQTPESLAELAARLRPLRTADAVRRLLRQCSDAR
jgi:phosphotransferase system enzyme I (PtsP)